MGNLCGKESDHFSTPGRRLDAAPEQPKSASVPAGVSKQQPPPPPPKKVGGPPRTLGGGNTGGGGGASSSTSAADDARRRAAEAAEQRANKANSSTGKLSSQLTAQKKQTRTDTLKEISDTQRRQRDMDSSADALNHN